MTPCFKINRRRDNRFQPPPDLLKYIKSDTLTGDGVNLSVKRPRVGGGNSLCRLEPTLPQ